jgi:protein gp37
MSANSKIEWCEHTFNPWIGCQKVSPACDHCYAESWAKYSGRVEFGPGKERRRTSEKNWRAPLKWNAEATRNKTRPRVFCASLADVFDNAVPLAWRVDLFRLIDATPSLIWMLLTKRIGNAERMIREARTNTAASMNWLGVTVCNQEEYDRDIPRLLQVPSWLSVMRFVSIEPMLGPIHLDLPTQPITFEWIEEEKWLWKPEIDLVIVGGETGPHARPMHPEWVRSIRDQCKEAGVPFFFKQWGEWFPRSQWEGNPELILPDDECVGWDSDAKIINTDDETFHRVGKKRAGCMLDGSEHKEFPK